MPEPDDLVALQRALDGLAQDTDASYVVVFGTHGLHLLRSGELEQVEAERATAIMTNVLLLARGAGKLTDRGEPETIVVRYESGALVLAPLGGSFGLGLLTNKAEGLAKIAYAMVGFITRTRHLLPQEHLVANAERVIL